MSHPEVDLLLVEDNPADVELTLHSLAQHDVAARIHVARDGAEALDFLRSTAAAPKVVFLDLKLPKIDGLEALRQLKADPRTRLIPVVMLTSSKMERDVLSSYRLGVNSYVQKPVDFEQFRAAVTQLGLYWLVANELPSPDSVTGEGRL